MSARGLDARLSAAAAGAQSPTAITAATAPPTRASASAAAAVAHVAKSSPAGIERRGPPSRMCGSRCDSAIAAAAPSRHASLTR